MKKTVRAHTNIALIKYWGKEDQAMRLPAMSSISMTLDEFYTDTKISDSEKDRFILNGTEQTGKSAQLNQIFLVKI